MTATEQREFVSSLVGRVLVTDSMPGNISHAHFLAAIVADYVKEKNLVVTSAHIAQIPHEELTPRAQKGSGQGYQEQEAEMLLRPTVEGRRRSSPE